LAKTLSDDLNDERKIERNLVLLLISTMLICIGIALILLGGHFVLPFLESVGSTAIGAGIIGVLYDVIVRKESSKDLHRELVNVIHNWDHISSLNNNKKERAILKFFNTYTTSELAEGCWESLIKPMFLQKEMVVREHFSHNVVIKRLNKSKLAKISIDSRYTEKNKGTKPFNLFRDVQPRFAIISDPKYFSYCKEQGGYIYMFSTPLDLCDFYKSYNIIASDNVNKEDLKGFFDVKMLIGDKEWSIDNGKIKVIKIDKQAIVYELTDKNIFLEGNEEKVVHILLNFINKTLRTYGVNIREVTKNVSIDIRYESEFDDREITPYVYFNVSPTTTPNKKKTHVYSSPIENDFSRINFDGWVFPLSGVLFTLLEKEENDVKEVNR
jgi:hypothetical protein